MPYAKELIYRMREAIGVEHPEDIDDNLQTSAAICDAISKYWQDVHPNDKIVIQYLSFAGRRLQEIRDKDGTQDEEEDEEEDQEEDEPEDPHGAARGSGDET